MRLSQAGDKLAYETLLTHAQKWLRGFFSRRIRADAVDDLVQETLMTLHAKRHTYNPSYPFLPWLAAIAKHRLIDHVRKVARLNEVLIEEGWDFADNTRDMSAAHDVETLLNRLPARQAKIIRLVKLDGMSIAETAALTRHSSASVKVMVHRGLRQLASIARGGK